MLSCLQRVWRTVAKTITVQVIDLMTCANCAFSSFRLSLQHYIKALAAAAEDSGLDVFERVGQLGDQIKPRSSVFVAPPVSAAPLVDPHKGSALHWLSFSQLILGFCASYAAVGCLPTRDTRLPTHRGASPATTEHGAGGCRGPASCRDVRICKGGQGGVTCR